jgi:S1-C subfamily serine protease
MVQDVESSSPSKDAGIQRGDIIVSMGSKSIRNAEEYYNALKDYAAGNAVALKILRNGKLLEIPVTASTFPANRAEELGYQRLGVIVENLGRSIAGVRISKIDPSSYLSRIGVIPGDVIRRIDEMPVNNKRDFEKAMVKYRLKPSLIILLQRNGNLYHITINP